MRKRLLGRGRPKGMPMMAALRDSEHGNPKTFKIPIEFDENGHRIGDQNELQRTGRTSAK